MEQQGAEHLLTPSRGRLNFKKMSLQNTHVEVMGR
jgi:hypothetical protein